MKKALVVLLAVAMIFCFAATAMAATYSDMADQTDAAKDAVAFNSALGIIGGYPDGTFGPAKNITRAEFAKIAVNAAGLADSADYLKNTASKFSDVKVGAWYTGFVNLAQSQGYLQGYPDGTFRPNATITNQEVVTVLLRMLGYTDNLTGPWPVDYINQAVKLDLLDDVNFVGAVPATRADVAVMTKATLDQNVVNWDKDKDAFVEATKANATYKLLEDAFGTKTVVPNKTVAGLTNATDLKLGSAFSYNKTTSKLVITVDGKDYTMTADTVISDEMTFDQLAGHIVNLILKDAGKKTETVAYVDVLSYVKAYDEVTTKPTAKTEKVVLDKKAYAIDEDAFVANNFAADGTKGNSSVYAYYNDDDEIYAVLPDTAITGADSLVVVKETANSRGRVAVFAGSAISISNDDDAMIIKDGKQIKVADLKKYDVVAKYGDVYLVSAMKTGKLTRIFGTATTPTALTLAGTKYVASIGFAIDKDDDAISKYSDYLNEDVQYVINAQNQVVAIITGVQSSATVKGIVTDFAKSTGAYDDTSLDTITVFTTEGKTATYKVDGKYALTNTDFAGTAKGDGNDYVVAAGKPVVTIGTYVEFKLDADNVIKSAVDYSADVQVGTTSNAISDNKDNITLNGSKYTIKDGVIVFNITKDTKDKIEVELLTYKDVVKSASFGATAETFTLAGADMTTHPIFAVLDGLQAKTLVVSNAGGVSSDKYGFLSANVFINADGKEAVTFVGDDTEYEVVGFGVGNVTTAKLAKNNFWKYSTSGGKVTFAGDKTTYATTDLGPLVFSEVTAVSGNLVTVTTYKSDGAPTPAPIVDTTKTYEITDDTLIYYINVTDDKDAEVAEAGEITKGDKVAAAVATGSEAAYIVILK